MTGGSGDPKLKLLLALRELVASNPISVRLRRVARGIHTFTMPPRALADDRCARPA